MPTIALALPIPPDKYETWRSTVTSFTGARRTEYDASRRRLGVRRSTSWVQDTPQGPIEILVVESADPARFFEGLATSQEPFDVEFRAFIREVYGLDLAQPAQAPLPELVLDWWAEER
jgi:hypothetical protein